MRTIGVLGGIGPQATMDFEARVHVVSQRLIPQRLNQGYPPMVTVYLRQPPVLFEPDGRPREPLEIEPSVLDTSRRLGQWADLIVSPCNTVHQFLDEVRDAAGCEMISIVDVTVAELRRREPERVGLLGLGIPQVYAERFERERIDVVTPPAGLRERLDDAILRLSEGVTEARHRSTAREAVDSVRAAGATVTVLGCTEIPLLLEAHSRAADLVDPAALLAEAAVRRAIG